MLHALLLLPLGPLSAVPAQDIELGRRHRMTPPAWLVERVEVAELTGDGVPDLLVRTPSSLELWAGAGDGRFAELAWSLALSYPDGDETLLDADGDGDLDVALARIGLCALDCTDSANRLYRNDGGGVFTDVSAQLPLNDDHPNEAALSGDVDADGDVDLVLGGSEHCWVDVFGVLHCATSAPLVWRNDGAGTFVDAPGALPALGEIVAGVAADLTGDGAVELFLDTGKEAVYRNDGAGAFTADFLAAGLHPANKDVAKASAVDADLDGDLDLVVSYRYQATNVPARLFLNDGAGALAWQPDALPEHAAELHAVLDLDQDGDPDLATLAKFEARRLANDGAGHFADLGAIAGAQLPRDAAAGDLDQDGDDDLLLGVELFLGDGAGAIARAEPIPQPVASSTRSVALLDLDGDQDLDVAIGNAQFGKNDLYANDGAGHFVSIPSGPAGAFGAEGSATDVIAADLDADGDPDLAATYLSAADPARTFTNAGGTLAAGATLPGTGGAPAIAAGDADGDGLADLAIARPFAATLVFQGAGGGAFSAGVALPGGAIEGSALLFVDFDGDGDQDLVQGTPSGDDHLYRNDAGTWVDAPALLPSNPHRTTAYAAGDVDQDGDLDLMAATAHPTLAVPNRLFENTGAGFVDATASLSPAEIDTLDLALIDLDRDGDLDALWLQEQGGAAVLANDAAGGFALVPGAAVEAAPSQAFDAGDLDGDGDVDLFVAGYGAHAVHSNLEGQLAWRALPRVGKPLAFDLDGAPGTPWVLAWSTGDAAIPLAPFGVLRLDPAHLHLLGAGAFDGAGRAALDVLVPATPALVGARLYAQALAGAPLLFGNLETVGLTGL